MAFFYAKSTEFTLHLFREWITEQRKDVSKSIDQFVLDRLLAKNNHSDSRTYPLDKLLIASGHAYFLERTNEKFGIRPLIAHANYIVSINEKIRHLKANNSTKKYLKN